MPTAKKSTSTASTKTAKVTKSTKAKAAGPTQSSSSTNNVAPPESPSLSRLHKRSRLGCYTCRLRRKKCDEVQPTCRACTNLCIKCEYKRPIWWSNAEQRMIQKERVKNKIKQTKLNERNGTFADHMASMATSPFALEFDFNRTPFFTRPYDPFASHLPTPALGPSPYAQFGPYQVDVTTERQTFINDIPTRHDSSTSTFNTFAPPYLHAALPPFPGEDWYREEHLNPPPPYGELNQAFCGAGGEQFWTSLQSTIPIDDHDRPLLQHFVDHVLRLAFPILEVHQQGPARARAILHSLETNKCYLHCCLSAAAVHRKATEGLTSESVDHDIMRHRYQAISLLCQAYNQNADLNQILEATLAMIFFHCSVGSPDDDCLPDIPWSTHFQAVTDMVTRLDLPAAMIECNNIFRPPPFNMILTAWVDILGATMLGKSPQFADLYRTKHLSGASSGLREVMGCDDRVMYLISEIACLDALKSEGLIDDMSVCTHVSALGNQLEFTEPPDQILEHPYCPESGALRPDQLTKNITSIFRTAARIYLCSLVPGFDKNQQSNLNLVAAVANMLQFIPGGPAGFDRCIVWPLLITGAFSVPSSPFRAVLEERVIALGDQADFGSFGRMYRLLQEVWRLSDDPPFTPTKSEPSSHSSSSPTVKQDGTSSPTAISTPGMREIRKQQIHWRDIIKRDEWRNYLII